MKRMTGGEAVKLFCVRNAVPIVFLVVSAIGIYYSQFTAQYLIQEMLTRLARNAFLVLSLLIPIMAGMGLNFGMVLGAMAGQIGLIFISDWNVSGLYGMTLAALIATPLAILKNPELGLKPLPDMLNMLLGIRGGSVGETCIVALLIGGVYLIWKKVITATTPVVFLLTIVVLSFCFGLNPAYELVAGGAVLGAFFMATDYATSPVTESGKVIFALGCGIITMLIRAFASYPEGVSFSILLMNILTPHIDNLTRKKPFGGVVK